MQQGAVFLASALRIRRMKFKKLTQTLVATGSAFVIAGSPAMARDQKAMNASTEQELHKLYKRLIDAENAHDIAAVSRFVWDSPSALFVAKTKNPAEGNWAGLWGKDTVVSHLGELYAGTFVMSPDYSGEKVVQLDDNVAETYVPLQISVAYAGQSRTPKTLPHDCRMGQG
jgi:hypothetical protein